MTSYDILHLSDTHLAADGALHYGVVDNRAGLARVLARASGIRRLDLVVCSGDLSDDGSPESYRLLADAVEPWAAQRGARVVYAMGNHDLRPGFREVLAPAAGADAAAPVFSTTMVGDLRVVVLDTSIPGAGYGAVDDAQLAWLRGVLGDPAPGGTVVVMHHPPIPAETVLLAALELQNPAAVLAVLAGTDVRAVFAGHYHLAMVDSAAGIPVIVSGGVANQADLFAADGTEGAVMGSSGTLVRLREDGTVRVLPFTAAGPDDGTAVFSYDAAVVAEITRVAGPPSR